MDLNLQHVAGLCPEKPPSVSGHYTAVRHKNTAQANWMPRMAGLYGNTLRGKDGEGKKRGMDVEKGWQGVWIQTASYSFTPGRTRKGSVIPIWHRKVDLSEFLSCSTLAQELLLLVLISVEVQDRIWSLRGSPPSLCTKWSLNKRALRVTAPCYRKINVFPAQEPP